MKKTLLLIMNPHAGVMKGKDNLFAICNTLCAADFDVSIRITQSPGHAISITREEGANFEYLVCCGGDGTLHEVVCGLQNISAESRPLLGYIPAGTTNDFAQNFGLSLNPAESVKRIADPQIVDIDIGNSEKNEKEITFSHTLHRLAHLQMLHTEHRRRQKMPSDTWPMYWTESHIWEILNQFICVSPRETEFLKTIISSLLFQIRQPLQK